MDYGLLSRSLCFTKLKHFRGSPRSLSLRHFDQGFMVGRTLSEVTDSRGMQVLTKAANETRAFEELDFFFDFVCNFRLLVKTRSELLKKSQEQNLMTAHFFPFEFLGLHLWQNLLEDISRHMRKCSF